MFKRIFLLVACIFFLAPTVHAQHQWVWGNEKINVYVEDSEVVWNEKFDECRVKVFDVIEGQDKYGSNEFYFYLSDGEWFYYIAGQKDIMPVTHQNCSANILEFAKKYLPQQEE